MSDESKDAARDERERFSQSTTQSRKKKSAAAAAEAVVVVAAPITPLKKGEEERTRAFSFFFSSLSLSALFFVLKYARFCFESHPEMWQVWKRERLYVRDDDDEFLDTCYESIA